MFILGKTFLDQLRYGLSGLTFSIFLLQFRNSKIAQISPTHPGGQNFLLK